MDESSKACARCSELKPPSEFSPDRRRATGLSSHCKECRREHWANKRAANPDAAREYDRVRFKDWADSNRVVARANTRRSEIKKRYGLTVEQYQEIIARGCAICGAQGGQMCLDHDHTTGKVRDALCGPCNLGLGAFRDKPERLLAASEYLVTHGKKLPQS